MGNGHAPTAERYKKNMEAPHARILHKELEIVAYEEGVAGAGEGVHGHAPAAELNSLVVQLPGSAVFRGLKVDLKNRYYSQLFFLFKFFLHKIIK